MSNRSENSGFWRSAPGILTALAGVVTAIAGLVAVLSDAGVLGPDERLRASVEAPRQGMALRDDTAAGAPATDVTGAWTATVTYPWNVTAQERFEFILEAGRLTGTASYLGTPRALIEPELRGDRIAFRTRVQQIAGGETSTYENVYDGLITERGIDFRLFDSRGEGPIHFTVRRP